MTAILAATFGMSPSASPEANRIALQAACAAAVLPSYVVLPEGTCDVGDAQDTSYAIKLTRGVDIRAHANGSTLRQTGASPGIGWRLFLITAGYGYRFGAGSDHGRGVLTLDGSGVQSPFVDQNHLVDLNVLDGEIADVRFDDVVFQNSGSGALNTGDGLRMVGSAVRGCTDIWIVGCTFYNCGRSGVSPNRGSGRIKVIGCTFDLSSDQHFDIESSGLAPVDGITIQGCTFLRNRTAGISISLGGADIVNVVRNVLIEDCDFTGGGALQGLFTENVTIRRCTFLPERLPAVYSTIAFLAYNLNLLIEDCHVEHYPEQGVLPAVQVFADFGTATDFLVIRDTTIVQYALAHCVELLQTNHVSFDGGEIQYRGTTDAAFYGVSLRLVGDSIKSFVMVDTVVDGQSAARLLCGIGTTPDAPFTFEGISIDRVAISGATIGLYTTGTQTAYADEPQFRGASLGAGVTPISQTSVSAPVVCIAGERGAANVRALSGWGNPEGSVTAPVGSSYVRRETGVTYYKATGTGNTGWVVQT